MLIGLFIYFFPSLCDTSRVFLPLQTETVETFDMKDIKNISLTNQSAK